MNLINRFYRRHSIVTYILGINVFRKKLPRFVVNPKQSQSNPKEVLIVKTDLIGDYILMRNFWKEIKESDKYKNAKITLILNAKLKGIPEFLDNDHVVKVLYLPEKPLSNLFEQEKSVEYLFKQGMKKEYDTIMFPSYNCYCNRYLYYLLISSIKANEIVGTAGDCPNNDSAIFLSFTDVIPVKKFDFEFAMNRDFFEEVLERKINYVVPEINIPKNLASKKYAVLSIGASDSFRKWHLLNYAKIGKYLKERYNLDVVIIGASSEQKEIDKLKELMDNDAISMVGKPLNEAIKLVNDAKIYIGNDSGFFHAAVACKTKSICISSGGSYPRFMRYPESDNYKILINEVLKKKAIENWQENKTSEYAEINTIRVKDVQKSIDELLSKTK